MITFTSDRATADASTDPSMVAWLYRSEGFAEDLDELVPAVLAPITAPALPVRARSTAPFWPKATGGSWLARSLGARPA